MKKIILVSAILFTFLITACTTTTVKEQISRFKGNFRYFAGIAEFYDCKTKQKYYLSEDGVYDELIKGYQDLNLKPKDDVYIRAEGFYREQEQEFGIDPIDVFVITKIIKFDTSRSCKKPYRVGL